jgi:ribosomal protein S12 methylthiotransferase accessory factor YcaO
MSGVRVDRATIVSIAVSAAGVKPATVRQWIARGIITQHPDGYDPDELLQWIETTRNVDQARGAVHASHVRHQTRRAG